MKFKFLFLFLLLISAFACTSGSEKTKDNSVHIRLNQVGYYPEAVKEFILVDYDADQFQIIDDQGKIVYDGTLMDRGTWESSGEKVLLGDFSAFNTPGTFKVRISENMNSYAFEIRSNIYKEALNAAVKSFYYQRASMPIEEPYGGIYARESGHPDLNCAFHPSSGKSEGTLDSPGGWYDAGDYGKYVVNASLSAGQMLNLVELYPEAVTDGQLNIPESGNGVGDLLDEIKYELDWILTMQDDDGGVYHKLTALNFGEFIMPAEYELQRYIIGKGTASTLNFAAVMAQASRIYKDVDSEWADQALKASRAAWEWANYNYNSPFQNPQDVVTGEYGDDRFDDDFYWAAAELYVTTLEDEFLDHLQRNNQRVEHQMTNSWRYFIRNMGFHSLITNRENLNDELTTELVEKYLDLSDQILTRILEIPYHVGIDHFEWGSNSDFLNQAMILCYAHSITGEDKYLGGVEQDLDYIFGKNAMGFSFLTGFGSKQVMNPHHRPSGADGIEAPVPGFIVGGPNKDKQDKEFTEYNSDYPAKSFADVQPSYASNEVCLNWNAPAVFVLGYLEQVK